MLKFSQLPTDDGCGRKLKVENAVIDGTHLGFEGHGFLTAYLHIKFEVGACGFGGYALGKQDLKTIERAGKPSIDYAAQFIASCLLVGMTDDWGQLKGKVIRVLHEGLGGRIVAIGHPFHDQWFCPKVQWKD